MQGKLWEALKRRAATGGRGEGAERGRQVSKVSWCWENNGAVTQPECREPGKRPETLTLEGQVLGKGWCPRTTAHTQVYQSQQRKPTLVRSKNQLAISFLLEKKESTVYKEHNIESLQSTTAISNTRQKVLYLGVLL